MTTPATTPADGVTDEQIMKALEASGVEFMAVYQPRLHADKVTTCGSIDAHKIVAGVRALLALATPSPGKADAEDAARYRWLREQHLNESHLAVVCHPKKSVKLGFDCPSGQRLDEAIDAATQQEREVTKL